MFRLAFKTLSITGVHLMQWPGCLLSNRSGFSQSAHDSIGNEVPSACRFLCNALIAIAAILSTGHSVFAQTDSLPASPLKYPRLQADTSSQTRFGIPITDPYRWIEKDKSKLVNSWLDAQQTLTQDYIAGIRHKARIKEGIKYFGTHDRLNLIKVGKYYFQFLRESQSASGPSLFYRTKIDDIDKRLIDPQTLSKKDRISINDLYLSKSGDYLAIICSRNEGESEEIRVIAMKDGKLLDDHVKDYDYSDIIPQKNGFAWHGAGFFYTHRGTVDKYSPIDLTTYDFNEQKSAQSVHYLYYHKLGTKQQEDKVIFANKANPFASLNIFVTQDERFLVIIEWNRVTNKTNVYLDDFEDGIQGASLVLRGIEGYIRCLEHMDGRILVMTDIQRDNYWLAYLELSNPHVLVPALNTDEHGAILKKAFVAGDQIITIYMKDDRQVMRMFDMQGNLELSYQVDNGLSFTDFMGSKGDPELFIITQSKVTSPLCGIYDLNKKKFVRKIASSHHRFNSDDYLYERHLFTSTDSVQVPVVTIRHKKRFNTDGSNPTLLSVYGGYGIISEPWCDPTIISLLENGGVYAEAYVRGGGELGSSWHKKGMGINKQNSVNDLIGAAQFLIDKNYTRPDRLAVTGASHGGFVVGTAVVKRPDLFRVAMPLVGMYSLIEDWLPIAEYSSGLDSTDFANRYALSAYYQAKEANYPSMLFITSPNDERVRPMESYRMVARLQQLNRSRNPILLYSFGSGHGLANSYTSWLNLRTVMLGFMFNEMGVTPRF
jgi:prolyl oligopeptidase